MKVLMITGDKRFGPGHPRFDAQAGAVERLEVIFWGRGALWPKVPQGPFDVVTVQDPFWRGLFAKRVARMLGARFNVQVHTDLAAQPRVRRVLASMVLRKATSVRVVSETIKKQVLRLGVRAPITVLPVFVELERFKAIVPVPHAQKTILWVGRFEYEKDPLRALEIIQTIPEATLVMLGSGSLEQKLRTVSGRLNLPVEFPGWHEPAGYLARADVVLSTSRHESWGQSIVEALAAGVPVVAPDVGIAREAGAVVVPRSDLGRAVAQVLASGTRGVLALSLPTKEAWAKEWAQSLV